MKLLFTLFMFGFPLLLGIVVVDVGFRLLDEVKRLFA